MIRRIVFASAFVVASASAQVDVTAHRAAADRLIDAATRDSAAHKRLSLLSDKFGHRFSGSATLENSLDWIMEEMKKDGFENVRGEPVMVTHWVRGTESAEVIAPRPIKLNILGLGRSVGTPVAGITAPIIVVKTFAELRARAAEAKEDRRLQSPLRYHDRAGRGVRSGSAVSRRGSRFGQGGRRGRGPRPLGNSPLSQHAPHRWHGVR